MTSKMFLDIVGVITTSKLSILSAFQGGGGSKPPPMSSRVNDSSIDSEDMAFHFFFIMKKYFFQSSNLFLFWFINVCLAWISKEARSEHGK